MLDCQHPDENLRLKEVKLERVLIRLKNIFIKEAKTTAKSQQTQNQLYATFRGICYLFEEADKETNNYCIGNRKLFKQITTADWGRSRDNGV